jgi:hypothetical protein
MATKNTLIMHFHHGFTALLLILLTLLTSNSLAADQCEKNLPRDVVNALLDKRFNEANKILQRWEKSATNTPIEPQFYQANVWLAQAKEQGKKKRLQLNLKALQRFQTITSLLSKKKFRSTNETLLLGMSEAFSARIFLEQEKWYSAYKLGRQARDRLRALLKEDPTQEDANLVLGLYEFYTGSVPSGLKWLSYLIDLSGNRQDGLVMLERAVKYSKTAAPEAARVLLDELNLSAPEVCQWLTLNKQMRSSYPNNARFSYALQKNYRRCGFSQLALEENLQGSKDFSNNRHISRNLLRQRLLIYRDRGDIEAIKSLKHRIIDQKYYAKRLHQAEYLRGVNKITPYQTPAIVYNDKVIRLSTCPLN